MADIIDFNMISAIMFAFIGFALVEIGLVLHFEPHNGGIMAIIAGTIVMAISGYYFYLLKYDHICESHIKKKNN